MGRTVDLAVRVTIDEDEDAPLTNELLVKTIRDTLKATGMVPARGRVALFEKVLVRVESRG